MKKKYLDYFPLFLSFLLFSIMFFIMYKNDIKGFGGIFIYAADDPFIHMTIIHNIIHNGYMGMSNGEFSTASSSILWTMLLTVIFYIFGEHTTIPLIMNYISGILIFWIVNKIAIKLELNLFFKFILMFSVLAFSGILLVGFVGMEHLLSAFLALLFLYILFKCYKENTSYVYLYIVSCFLAASRYETLFLILGACIFLFIKKRYINSILLGLSSLIFVVGAGIYFIKNGGYFVPNTLLVKANLPSIHSVIQFFHYLWYPFLNFIYSNLILIAIYLVFVVCKPEKTDKKFVHAILLIYVIHGYLFDLFFGNVSNYFRYVLFCNIFRFTFIIYLLQLIYVKIKNINKSIIIKILIFVLTVEFLWYVSLFTSGYANMVKKTTTEIYTQQYQMSKFVKKYYDNTNVAANDIGMISYFSNIKLLDLWGLASEDVVKAKRNGYFNVQFLDKITKEKNVKIIMIYDDWFKKYAGGVPFNWYKIAEWNYEKPIIVGKKVSFYVLNKSDKTKAIENMENFEKELPKQVQVKIYK